MTPWRPLFSHRVLCALPHNEDFISEALICYRLSCPEAAEPSHWVCLHQPGLKASSNFLFLQCQIFLKVISDAGQPRPHPPAPTYSTADLIRHIWEGIDYLEIKPLARIIVPPQDLISKIRELTCVYFCTFLFQTQRKTEPLSWERVFLPLGLISQIHIVFPKNCPKTEKGPHPHTHRPANH